MFEVYTPPADYADPWSKPFCIRQSGFRRKAARVVPRGAEVQLWATLELSYFSRHDAGDIAWHARVLRGLVDRGTSNPRGPKRLAAVA